MKIFNKLTAAVMALPFMVGLTACHDEHPDYTPAQAVSNAQVFFSQQTLATATRELDMTATSFDIEIQRVKTEGELTVALENRQDANSTTQLNVPTSVTFADGEAKATITVTYDPTTIDFDDLNGDTIVIADAQYTTPYGGTEYRFGALVPEPWTDWTSTSAAFASEGGQGNFPLGDAGKGDYTYGGMYFDGDDPGLPISFRQNKLNPNQGEFKIEHWGRDVDLVLEAEWDESRGIWRIHVPATNIGTEYQDLGPIYVCDYIALYDMLGRDPLTWEILERNGLESSYDPVSGKFSLYVLYVISDGRGFGEGEEYFQVDGFYVPDYSAVPTFEGVLTKDDQPYAQVTMEFGTDVQKVLGYIVEKGADKDAVADALAAGEVEGVELVAGINNLPLGDLTGELLLVVASVVDGEVAYHDAVSFGYYGGGKNPWQALGTGYFTDDMILPLFGYEADDYPVEIEESTETPGVYRLLAMYSAVAADFGVESGTGDVIVNAEDPDAVYILPQPLELTLGSNGPFSISTDAGEYVAEYGFEAVKAQLPEIFATLKDGVISFPVLTDEREDGTTMNYQLWAVMNGKYYYAGRAGQFKIVLPEAAAEVKAKAASAARAKSFRARLTAKSGYKRADMRKKMGKSMKMSHRKPALNKGFKAKTL